MKNRLLKCLMVISILGFTITLTSGVTHAWYVAKKQSTYVFKMADLDIGVEVEGLSSGVEPGNQSLIEGTVRNTGKSDALIELNIVPTSYIYWDTQTNTDGEQVIIAPLAEPLVVQNDPNVQLKKPYFTEDFPVYDANMDMDSPHYGDFYVWMKHRQEERYFLIIAGNSFDVKMGYEVKMDGNSMGNQYQNADIHIQSKAVATQWWEEEALQQYFQVTMDDLEICDINNQRRNSSGNDIKKAFILEQIAKRQ